MGTIADGKADLMGMDILIAVIAAFVGIGIGILARHLYASRAQDSAEKRADHILRKRNSRATRSGRKRP